MLKGRGWTFYWSDPSSIFCLINKIGRTFTLPKPSFCPVLYTLHSQYSITKPVHFPSSLRSRMSRHNRRRKRCGYKTSKCGSYDAFELLFSAYTSDSNPSEAKHPRRRNFFASHWQSQSWRAREKSQRDECERLEVERTRIFGGEGMGGEDEGLCLRMMDYFLTLDYLEE